MMPRLFHIVLIQAGYKLLGSSNTHSLASQSAGIIGISYHTRQDSTSSSMENTDGCWCELFRELCKINAFDTPDSPFMRGKEFSDSVHNTFDHMWRTKEHNEVG